MKNPSLNYDNGSIATQKYNIPPKALPLLVCTKNTAFGDVSRDKYSTRLHLVLHLSLNTPPRGVLSILTRGSALSNMCACIVCICVYACACMCVCNVYVCVCMCVCVCVCICVYMCVYVCMSVCLSVCLSVCQS